MLILLWWWHWCTSYIHWGLHILWFGLEMISTWHAGKLNILMFSCALNLKLFQKLVVILDLVVYVLFTGRMLLTSKRRAMLEVDTTVLAIKVGHIL